MIIPQSLEIWAYVLGAFFGACLGNIVGFILLTIAMMMAKKKEV